MTREKLPARRLTQTFKFKFEGIKHHCSISYYRDGRLGEVFIDSGKVNTGIQNFARDGAILISIALQHGAQLATLRAAMTRGENNEPASLMGKLLDSISEIENG